MDNTSISRTKKQKWEEKQLHRHFNRQTNEISHEKIWTWLRKGNLKREIESSAKQCHEDYVKARIDKIQQNSRWILSRD